MIQSQDKGMLQFAAIFPTEASLSEQDPRNQLCMTCLRWRTSAFLGLEALGESDKSQEASPGKMRIGGKCA